MRPLNAEEKERLASGLGVTGLAVTCASDNGYGPCGTYHDWIDGKCAEGHEIGIEEPICDECGEVLTADEEIDDGD